MFDRINIGAKTQAKRIIMKTANHSNCPTLNPLVDPAPAKPIICSLEIFVAKIEVPKANQPKFFPAKKYSLVLRSFLREYKKPIASMNPK